MLWTRNWNEQAEMVAMMMPPSAVMPSMPTPFSLDQGEKESYIGNKPKRLKAKVMTASNENHNDLLQHNSLPNMHNDDATACAACREPGEWTAQAGQDLYVWQRVLRPQRDLCCQGRFVEFGARDGLRHANTAALEQFQQWTGLLAEVDVRLLFLSFLLVMRVRVCFD